MQSDLLYTADESLKRRLCNSIVQRSSSAPKVAIFEIRRQFHQGIPVWILTKPKVQLFKVVALQTLEGHTGGVTSVAFPSDNRSCPGPRTRRCGSGTRRPRRCRRSRAARPCQLSRLLSRRQGGGRWSAFIGKLVKGRRRNLIWLHPDLR